MNATCEECGARCCKTLMISDVPNMTKDSRDLVMMRRVAESAGQVWLDCSCMFLNGGRCLIYEVRPPVCRAYQVDGDSCKATREHVPKGTE